MPISCLRYLPPHLSEALHFPGKLLAPLFFYNDYNSYIVGMDPSFLYLYEPRLYWQWYSIGWVGGVVCSSKEACYKRNYCAPDDDLKIHDAIINNFKSHFIFINNKNFFTQDDRRLFRV